jgi:peptidyl-prolyl cis-trans isomerase C
MIYKGWRLMKILCVRLLVWAGVLLLCLPGCRDEKGGKAVVEKTDSNILARIGDEEITKADLEAALEQIPEGKREALRTKVIDDLIKVKVFADEARKAGLDNDPQVKAQLEETTDDSLARSFVKRYLDTQAQPSEEEAKQYYLDHKEDFVIPEGVLLQQIVVKKKEQAEAVLAALKAGEAFETLAKKESIARSWKDEGRLGWQYKGWLEPAEEEAAFSLEKGKLSEIIKTKAGYEIIKVLDKRDQRQAPFEEARQRIRSSLFSARKKELVNQYYEKAGLERGPEAGVLARIGKEVITEETLAPKLVGVPEKRKEEARRRWVDYLVEKRVFSDEARKVHLENDPEVAAALKHATEGVLAGAFYERFIKEKIQVSDEDIKRYYESHLEEFREPVRLRVKSILVKTEEEAQKILGELEAGASFGQLAIEYSLYPSASRRAGEIGWFKEGEKDPALEAVAFALEKGERSDIIKTEAGYEIIKLMDRKGGTVEPLDQARQIIEMNLVRQGFEEEKERYYQKAGVKLLGA